MQSAARLSFRRSTFVDFRRGSPQREPFPPMSGPPASAPDRTLLAAYARRTADAVAWDEMVGSSAELRPAWRDLGVAIDALGASGLMERRRSVERLLADDGVTYRRLASPVEQAWDLDPIPVGPRGGAMDDAGAGARPAG